MSSTDDDGQDAGLLALCRPLGVVTGRIGLHLQGAAVLRGDDGELALFVQFIAGDLAWSPTVQGDPGLDELDDSLAGAEDQVALDSLLDLRRRLLGD